MLRLVDNPMMKIGHIERVFLLLLLSLLSFSDSWLEDYERHTRSSWSSVGCWST